MAAILNSAILNLAILDSAILVFPLKLTHTCQDWFPPFAQKNFTHSFWLNLMMAAILNSAMLDSDTAILDSDTLLSSLRFTQKHSHSTLTLTQTNSIWLKLIHSHSTWWWQPSWILPSWIGHLGFSHLSFSSQTHSHLPRLVPTICTKKTSLIHSDSTWWWQPSWILPCWIQTLPSWIQTPCYLLSDSLKNTLTPLWLWLKLIQSDSNSFILTQLDDGSHLEFCHLEFSHLGFSIILHKLTLTQTNSIWLKLIHSDSTWWWQPSWIQTLPSWIQTPCYLLSDSLKNTLTPLWLWLKLIQSDSNSFILTQLDDGSHLEFCHLEFGHLGFSHLSFPLKLTHTCQDWFPPFAQKNLHSFILTQLDDGSHLEFCHVGFRHCHLGFRHLVIFSQIHSKTLSLHSDSWLKLIQSDSNSFILT